MSDPITAAVLNTTIGTVTGFGGNVVARLTEDQSSVNAIPQPLRGLDVDLPVILETLQRLKDHAADGRFGDETCTKLKGVVDSCHAQIKALYQIMESIRPSTKDSVGERAYKALQSVRHEKEIQRLRVQLAEHRSVLMDHVIVCSMSPQVADPGKEKAFSAPCERDPDHCGRPAVMQQVLQTLKDPNPICLTGIGDVE